MTDMLLHETDPEYLEHLFRTERYVWLALSYDMAAVIDMEGCFRDANTPWERTTGHSVEELVGAYLMEYIHFADRERTLAALQSLVTSDIGSTQISFRFRCKDGVLKQMSWNVIYSPDHNRYYCVVKDVTSRTAEDAMAIAYQDALTGLHNRLYLDDHFPLMLERAESEARSVVVMFVDLDGFKAINDTYGHKAGDVLLQKVSKRIGKALEGESCLVTRIGGDEFVIVCDCTGTCINRADEVVRLLKEPFFIADEKMQIGASVGISHFPEQSTSPEELLEFADRAMYQVKRASKNGVSVYQPEES